MFHGLAARCVCMRTPTPALQHELREQCRQQLFTASEAMRGSPRCQLNVGAKRDDTLTLGGQPYFRSPSTLPA